MAWAFVWSIHPVANYDWARNVVLMGLLWFSGPLIAFAISLGALTLGKATSSRLMKRAVAVHFWLSLIIALVGLTISHLGFLSGLFMLLAALVDLPILVLAPSRVDNPIAGKLVHTSVVLSIAGPVVGLFVWSALNVKIVEWRALAVAGSYPYCVQVPAGYLGLSKTVTQSAELTGLRMRTPFTNGGGSADFQFAFHAVLVVRKGGENKFYNWSYFAQNFVPVSDSAAKSLHLRAACDPKVAFFDTLTRAF